MNHLMPEQRADKNGKLVVRHVKVDKVAKLHMAAIPAPSLVSQAESNDEIIKREMIACGSSEHEASDYLGFLDARGDRTKRIIAKALTNRRDHGDYAAIKHVMAVSVEAGVMQLATSDISFMRRLADCFPADGRMSPQRSAFNLIENAFRENFKLTRFQDSVNEINYLKHADAFRVTVLSNLLGVKDNVPSSFEAREQEAHILENLDEFLENLPEHVKASAALNDWNLNPTSHDILSMSRMVKEFGSTTDAVVAAVIERKRYDEDEIRAVLTTAPALSQGAL
jgi:hypothetical protein